MDPRTVMFISNLLLLTAVSEQATHEQASNMTSSPAQTSNNTSRDCSCPSAAPTATAASVNTPGRVAPVFGLLTVRWSNCNGEVHLTLHHPSNSLPVCHQNQKNIQGVLGNVCENNRGCTIVLQWEKGGKTKSFNITESGAEEVTCDTLKVFCRVGQSADLQGQLQAYKVVTALLCCALLVFLVIRFTRPTVKALQKRLSDRRQNRWIGPTQSHSVSYHRGKAAVRNDDGEKRVSYPALERLAVSDSREPSSNRNSDYNF